MATMSEPLALQLSVVYREIEDGWIMATIPELPAAVSQGRTREEARENVRDALRELLLSYAREGAPAPIDPQNWSWQDELQRLTYFEAMAYAADRRCRAEMGKS